MTPSLATDILIVGAGPAGSTFARELPKHLKAILLDKRKLDSSVIFPDKTCGGLLAPDAQECLLQMKLSLPNDILSTPQLFGVRAIDLESGHSQYFQRHYTNLARDKFDRWLFNLACEQSNITPLVGKQFLSFKQTTDGITVTLTDGTTITCKYIVGADGAHSRLRKTLSTDPFAADIAPIQKTDSFLKKKIHTLQQWYAPQRNLAVQYWYKTSTLSTEYGSFFHQKVTNQYAWSIPKQEFLIVGTTMPWPTAHNKKQYIEQRMNILTTALNQHDYNLTLPVYKESCALLTPGLTMPFALGQNNVLLLGEAAGLISPSSAEGISYAFRSAMTLAKVFVSHPLSDNTAILAHYNKQLSPLLWRLRSKWIKATAVYLPAIRRPILASGLSASSKLW